MARRLPARGEHPAHGHTLPDGGGQGQILPDGTVRPGGWGTFQRLDTAQQARDDLAIRSDFKPTLDYVLTFEVTAPLRADRPDGRAGGTGRLPPAARRVDPASDAGPARRPDALFEGG
jgi:hypothetical protein